jgi:hypothetical protein
MNSLLLGAWVFTTVIYRGQEIPRPNPNLVMTFNFQTDGRNFLHYHRIGEQGECNRTARYEFSDNQLIQEVLSVDPNNASSCSSDPDMQQGQISATPITLEDGRMKMLLNLGNETITYIWKPCQRNPDDKTCEEVAGLD